MKNIFLLLLIPAYCFSQDCSTLKSDIDEFTEEVSYSTEEQTIRFEGFYDHATYGVRFNDGKYYLAVGVIAKGSYCVGDESMLYIKYTDKSIDSLSYTGDTDCSGPYGNYLLHDKAIQNLSEQNIDILRMEFDEGSPINIILPEFLDSAFFGQDSINPKEHIKANVNCLLDASGYQIKADIGTLNSSNPSFEWYHIIIFILTLFVGGWLHSKIRKRRF